MYQTDFEAGEIPDGNTVLISHWKFTENEITEIDALLEVDLLQSQPS